jgi:phage shock protein C
MKGKDDMAVKKRLTRSRTNRMIGGVCGGLGEYFNLDPTLIRIAFVALILLGMGSPLLGYILLWIIIPRGDKVDARDDSVKGELPVTLPATTADQKEQVTA